MNHVDNIRRLTGIEIQLGVLVEKLDNLKETKAEAINGIRTELRDHAVMDRWIQGSMLTLLIVIIGKLFIH